MSGWVYILECADGSYYTGCTTTFEHRMWQHDTGKRGYTSTRRPLTCVFAAETADIREAIAWERQIKGWSRAKKQALIAGKFEDLPGLARSRQHHGASFDTPAKRAAQDD